MPDFFGVYDDMKVIEYLEFFAAAYRIKGPARKQKCEQVLELVDLTYKRDALVTSLSRGMTQRLGLARVLLHEPQVLLLDEPASGLDPRARIEMRGLLKELRNMGKTIMVSSHILPELADICNKIGIIERGKLIFDGDLQTAIRQVRQRHGEVVPQSLVQNRRFAFIPNDAKLLGGRRRFGRHGRSGAEISELLPHIASIADDIAIVRSLRTEAINHGPAKLFINTGSSRPGRPSMGAWVTYGIGSESANLPGFVVLQTGRRGPRGGATLYSNGFLPASHQGRKPLL